MNCVDCHNALAEFALDSLEPREKQQVADHLAGCLDCKRHLEDVRESWATLAGTLQPASPPPRLKADLLARLSAEPRSQTIRSRQIFSAAPEPVTLLRESRNTEGAWRWRSVAPYVAVTLCGIALGFWFGRSRTIDSQLVDRYHSQLLHAERTFGAPQMRFAALHVFDNRPNVQGYLIWDSLAEELHAYAFDLKPPGEGAAYRLWFDSNGTWIAAGDLNVGLHGVCSAVLSTPPSENPTTRIVVTTEPIDGPNVDTKPQGPIGLSGQFL
jgi:hypothetical protein